MGTIYKLRDIILHACTSGCSYHWNIHTYLHTVNKLLTLILKSTFSTIKLWALTILLQIEEHCLFCILLWIYAILYWHLWLLSHSLLIWCLNRAGTCVKDEQRSAHSNTRITKFQLGFVTNKPLQLDGLGRLRCAESHYNRSAQAKHKPQYRKTTVLDVYD